MTSAVSRVLGQEAVVEPTVTESRSWSPFLLVAVVAVALVGVGLAVGNQNGLTAREVVAAALIAAWALATAAVAVRPKLQPLAAVVGAATVLAAVTYVACAYATTGETSGAFLLRGLGIGLLPAAAGWLLMSLPDGRLPTRTHRAAVAVLVTVGVAVGLFTWSSRPDIPAVATWIWSVAAVVVGAGFANRRYLGANGIDRQRLQWLGCAAAVTLEAALLIAALRLLADWPPRAGPAVAATTILLPLGIALGASRRLAARADRLLVATVSVIGLTAVVSAIYLAIVIGLGRVPTDAERQILVLSMAAAGVAALFYVPVRDRLRDIANRLVYGERDPPDAVLRTFGSRLSRAVPLDELLLQLVESLSKTMSLQRAEVWTGADGRMDLAVSVPHEAPRKITLEPGQYPVVARGGVGGNAWASAWVPGLVDERPDCLLRVAPAVNSGEVHGLIVAERAVDAELFTDEEDDVLVELARQVGLALHNVELDSALEQSLDDLRATAEQLRQSRSRIVATADAERRKIERNLHDGAQQHLVALAVNLRLARDILDDDPTAAAEMLDLLADSVKETVQELRDLAHGIYPPLLVDAGLGEALASAASRSPLDVGLDHGDVGRFASEVEAAVYFCCLEALQNAAKHAPGSSVELTLRGADGVLTFTVADDGPGFDIDTATAGHGYLNMADRLGALGGTVVWDSEPGAGARIEGRVPISSDHEA